MTLPRARTALGAFALLCAACGSVPPTHFHTLLATPSGATASTPLPPVAPWDLLPVTVPPQADQPGWVVRLADGSLALLENERWAAPLADEIRSALAERLRAATPVLRRAPWRIAVDVQRFETVPGRYTRIDAEWSVAKADADQPRQRCRASFEQPATASFPALAAAHREALARLGAAIAATLQALDAGAAATCG